MARNVKIADLKDNMGLRRYDNIAIILPEEIDRINKRQQKYQKALLFLMGN